MKAFLTSVAVLTLVLLGTRANAQTRALGAHELVLDDGSGHTLTITTSTMSSNQTFTFPAATTYTPGSVLFADGNGAINQNNGEFFWNNTNNRLGIGNAAPAYPLDVTGAINTSTGYFIGGNTVLADNGSLSLGVNTGLPGSGVLNVFLGDYAGQNNAGGHENTFTGEDAGQSNTTGYENTFSGYDAGNINTTGYQNTATGSGAMAANSDGFFNTAAGYYSLNANTHGYANVAIGTYAMSSNTTGWTNVAVGDGCMQNEVAGSENTAVGLEAYSVSASGNNYVTAVGSHALMYNTVDSNTAVGAYSLYLNTTGASNTALGINSLSQNRTGSGNTAVGDDALRGNIFVGYSTGSNNTAVGNFALQLNVSGASNTATGQTALSKNASGSYNTADGYLAGNTNLTGTHLTLLGSQADVSVNGLTNATAIGNQATVTASNTIQLGNSSVTDVYTSGTIHAGKLVTGATLGNGGTPAAGAVYVDNVIRAWGNIPAGGTTAFGEFGISSYTHTNGTGVYNLTLATSLASTSDGAVIVHTRDIGTSGWAYFTGPNTINVQTFSDFGVTAADEAFFIQVVGR